LFCLGRIEGAAANTVLANYSRFFAYAYTGSHINNKPTFWLYLFFAKMYIDFRNYYNVTLSRSFAVKTLFKIPLYLNWVAALPCAIVLSAN